MGDGLEFLKSWRFWVVLTSSTSAVMIGTVGVSVMLTLYFPHMAGGAHGFFSMLAGFAFCFPVAGVFLLFYRSHNWARALPDEHPHRLFIGVSAATGIIVLSETAAVYWLLVMPIRAGSADGSVAPLASLAAANLFGLAFGNVIAHFEQASIMDAKYGLDETVAPR